MGIMLLLIFYFSVRKCPFCVTLGLPFPSQEEILIAVALVGGRQRLAFFRYLRFLGGNLLLSTTCASIVGDMVISSTQETHGWHLHVDNNTPWLPTLASRLVLSAGQERFS